MESRTRVFRSLLQHHSGDAECMEMADSGFSTFTLAEHPICDRIIYFTKQGIGQSPLGASPYQFGNWTTTRSRGDWLALTHSSGCQVRYVYLIMERARETER